MKNSDLENLAENRVSIIDHLTNGPKTKPDLVQDLPISRSTVDRAIEELLKKDLVKKCGSEYLLTEPGQLLIDEYESYIMCMNDIRAVAPIIKKLPRNTIDIEFIRGSCVIPADRKRPSLVIEKTYDLIQPSENLRGTLPVAFEQYFRNASEMILEYGTTAELIFDIDLYKSLTNEKHNILTQYEEKGSTNILTTKLPSTHSIWIAETPHDSYGGITVYDNGRIEGVIYNTSETAIDWLDKQYIQCKRKSTL